MTPNGPSVASGVIYICYSATDVIYIGQTVGWKARRSLHMRTAWWSEVTEIRFIPAHDSEERERNERSLIEIFNPQYNWKHTRRPGRKARYLEERWVPSNDLFKRNRAMDKAGLGPKEINPTGFAYSRDLTRGDLDAESWTHHDIAAYLGVGNQTAWRYYWSGFMPPADGGGRLDPTWRPSTITAWLPQGHGRVRPIDEYRAS